MTEPSEESSAAPETIDEIEYDNLTIAQKHVADQILEMHNRIYTWPRQSGKSTVTRYVIQEMKKKDRQ